MCIKLHEFGTVNDLDPFHAICNFFVVFFSIKSVRFKAWEINNMFLCFWHTAVIKCAFRGTKLSYSHENVVINGWKSCTILYLLNVFNAFETRNKQNVFFLFWNFISQLWWERFIRQTILMNFSIRYSYNERGDNHSYHSCHLYLSSIRTTKSDIITIYTIFIQFEMSTICWPLRF